MLGRFLEIAIQTADIRASVEFYERLGFTQAITSDAWPHPYGVLTDGRVCIGLHQRRLPSPALTFVHPGVAGQVAALERLGIELSVMQTGSEAFNEIGFEDPSGQAVRVLEARTYSPPGRSPLEPSLCGYFSEFSLPATDFEPVRRFWEAFGFVSLGEEAGPYAREPVTSDGIDLAMHQARFHPEPMLVFRDGEMAARIAHLREHNIGSLRLPPRRLDARENALLTAPEGTTLLLLQEGDGGG